MKIAVILIGLVLLTTLFLGCSGTPEQQPPTTGGATLDSEVEQVMDNDLVTPEDTVEIGEMI